MTQVIEKIGGEYENRTRVRGFAIRCITTLPTRRRVVGAGLAQLICACKASSVQFASS